MSYLPLEWPAEIGELRDFPIVDFALDWYRLRKAGTLAHDLVPPHRIEAYRAAARSLETRNLAPEGGQAALAAALRLMEACLAGPDLVDHQLNLGPAKLEIV